MVDYRGDDPGIIMGNKNGDGVIEPPMNSMNLWRVFPYPLDSLNPLENGPPDVPSPMLPTCAYDTYRFPWRKPMVSGEDLQPIQRIHQEMPAIQGCLGSHGPIYLLVNVHRKHFLWVNPLFQWPFSIANC